MTLLQTCSLTILRSAAGKIAGKEWYLDSDAHFAVRPYQLDSLFHYDNVEVDGLPSLSRVLKRLESKRDTMVIRGRLRDGIDRTQPVYRRMNNHPEKGRACFERAARQWVMLDLDSIPRPKRLNPRHHPEKVIEFVMAQLPVPFRQVSCYWQFSASQNMRKNWPIQDPVPNKWIKLHIWFYLDRPVSDEELKAFFRQANGPKVDLALFNAVQPHYTAAPTFGTGVANPLPQRSGLWEGKNDHVVFPHVDVPVRAKTSRKGRSTRSGAEKTTLPGKRLTDHEITKIESALEHIESTERDTWIKVGMALKSTGDHKRGFDIWTKWSQRCAAKFDSDDQERIWDSFNDLEGGIGIGKLFHLAKENGWVDIHANKLIPDVPPPPLSKPVSVRKGTRTLLSILADLLANRFVDGKSRTLAVVMPPGTGKSTLTIDQLIALGLRVEFYVPNHALGEEAIVRLLQRHGHHVDVVAIYGRNHDGVGGSVCHKHEAVEALADKGIHSVFGLLCKAGKDVECEHFGNCLWMSQNDPRQLKFLPHVMLPLPRSAFDKQTPDVVVIDEDFLQHAVSKGEWPLDALLTSGEPLLEEIAVTLTKGQPLLPRLRRKFGDLKAEIEGIEAPEPWLPKIDPLMGSKESLRVVKSFKPASIPDFTLLLTVLQEALEAEIEETQGIWYDRSKKVVKAASLRPFERIEGIPTLILDGTMNIDAIRRLFPTVEYHRIDIRRRYQGPTIQVYDTALSKASLLHADHYTDDSRDWKERRKQRVERRIRALYRELGPGLIVGPKRYMKQLEVPEECDVAHFGNLRGQNAWEELTWVVVIGRNEPWAMDIEEMARAFWGNDPEPLQLPGQFDLTERGYRLRSGQHVGIGVWEHPDDRVNGFLHLVRESESIQAIDRLRMIHGAREGQKPLRTIYLVSNLPLDLEIDRLITMDHWLTDHPLEVIWKKERGTLSMSSKWLLENHEQEFVKWGSRRLNRGSGANERAIRAILEDQRNNAKNVYINTIYESGVIHGFRVVGKRGRPGHALSLWSAAKTEQNLSKQYGAPVKIKESSYPGLQVILSSGASGVGKAALDAAQAHQLVHGGYCSSRRYSGSRLVPRRYPLFDARTTQIPKLTRINMDHADGTLILVPNESGVYARRRKRLATKAGIPVLAVSFRSQNTDKVRRWITHHQIRVLHVVGPLNGYRSARRFLNQLLGSMCTSRISSERLVSNR